MKVFLNATAPITAPTSSSAVIDALPGHVALLDRDGIVIAVNEGWRRFARANGYSGEGYGVGASYLVGCGGDRDQPSPFAREAVQAVSDVLSGAVPCASFDYPCHVPERPQWFRMLVSPWPVDARGGALVMHFDVTEECQHREVLLRGLRLDGAVKKRIAGVIHDVKSPLNAIAGISELMRREIAGPTTPKQQEYLSQVLNACAHACELIDSEAGRLFDEPSETPPPLLNVVAILESHAEMLAPEAAKAGVRIETVLAQRMPKLAVPAAALSRIVDNLVINAIRHAGAGAQVVISAEPRDNELAITVADDGIGVAEDELQSLGRSRQRGRRAKGPGAGLGLAVVRDLASIYGARFAAASAPGKGLRVTLTFGADTVVPIDDNPALAASGA